MQVTVKDTRTITTFEEVPDGGVFIGSSGTPYIRVPLVEGKDINAFNAVELYHGAPRFFAGTTSVVLAKSLTIGV